MAYPYKPVKAGDMIDHVSPEEMTARILQIELELLMDELSPQSYLWLVEMAEDGDPHARNILFYYLMEHEDINFDWCKMERWAKEYIEEDPAEAFNMLSSLYAPGMPGFVDLEMCLHYLEQAVEVGSTTAVYRLAMIADELLRDKYPPEKIRNMLEKCDLKDAPSDVMRILERICREMGDYAAALRAARTWQKRYPAEPESNLMLAYYYANGKGVKQDYKLAMKYFQKAANLGDPRGLFYVGIMYSTGDGCRRNSGRAADYFRRAVQAGGDEALASLAKCYLMGDGVKADVARGLELLRTGVEKEQYSCCYMLALCYYEGKYVPRDIRQTQELLRLAVRYRKELEVEIFDDEIVALGALCYAALQDEAQAAFLPGFEERWAEVGAGSDPAVVDALLNEAAHECPWHERVQTCISEALEKKRCSAEGRRRVMSTLRFMAKSHSKVSLFVARMYEEGRVIRRSPSTAYRHYVMTWQLAPSEELAIDIFLRLVDGSLSNLTGKRSEWLSVLIECYGQSPRVNYMRGLMHAIGGLFRRSKKLADDFFRRAADGGLSADPVADARAIRKGTKSLRECLNFAE